MKPRTVALGCGAVALFVVMVVFAVHFWRNGRDVAAIWFTVASWGVVAATFLAVVLNSLASPTPPEPRARKLPRRR